MRLFTILALAVAIGLGTAASPFASSAPDGLERVAADKAFLDAGKLAPIQERAPARDYAIPGVADERLATGLAGFLGTLAVFAAGYGIAAVASGRRPAT